MGILIILLALTFSYGMFQGGFVSWFLFFSFLPFALYSFLLQLYPLSDFKVERLIQPDKGHAGENALVSLTLSRKFPFPLFFLVVEDLVPIRLNSTKGKQIIFPGMKKRYEYLIRLKKFQGENMFLRPFVLRQVI